MKIIAEIKTHSPFGYKSSRSWDELFNVANEIGDIISVHTDFRWHGSFDFILRAKSLTKKPILAKGIHARDEDITRLVKLGADFVLVVGRLPGVHSEQCIIEPNSLEELEKLSTDTKVIWNSRDLSTGGLKTSKFSDARAIFPGWLCQASNIALLKDIENSADAILIGTHLEDVAKELKGRL